jgi:hypothetical protein
VAGYRDADQTKTGSEGVLMLGDNTASWVLETMRLRDKEGILIGSESALLPCSSDTKGGRICQSVNL